MIRPPGIIGRRGTVLLFLALVDLAYALSLWRPAGATTQAASTRLLAHIMPLPWWAGLWLAVGVACLAAAFVHRLDRIAFPAASGIKALWGTVFLFGWLIAGLDRGWVAAIVWYGFALLVGVIAGWAEPVTVDAGEPAR